MGEKGVPTLVCGGGVGKALGTGLLATDHWEAPRKTVAVLKMQVSGIFF